QNKLSTAIKHSSESIIITDTNGIIEFVNPAFETATGYKSEEVLGKNPSVLKSNQHDKKFYENLWRTILSGKSWKGHFINKKKDGTFFEEEASVSPVFDNNGEIINFVALQRDVSDMIKIENQLRHAQKMEGIGTLAAGIAHEINTPLQYLYDNTLFIKDSFQVILDSISQVKALAGIYSNDKKTDNDNNFAAMKDILTKDNLEYLTDEIPKAIEENINGLKIVRKIVLAMKDFSHPGLQTMQKADINDAISSTVIITKNVWKFHAEVVTEFEETLPEVTCHIGDINQVFLNMITNSCDAIVEKNGCDAKGVIRIKTRSDENFVYVTIQDTGSGIPQKIIDKIFHPFFTTKDVGKGTGQGLALSYDIITNKHNGEIIVESEIGVGTKFVIKLPIEYKE
ncbi:MAG: PAS domain S-box protein, partial [Candidatus Delongbacteria bacterium]|nr:PAS domain S-box protein [Candidatus Delongbacteria bacterium]MCG2759776.1 PAS domain S-box protein [Candidatus Delongbacteria bacterium]